MKDFYLNKFRAFIFPQGNYYYVKIRFCNDVFYFKKLRKNQDKNTRELIHFIDPAKERARFLSRQAATNAFRRFYPNKFVKYTDDDKINF